MKIILSSDRSVFWIVVGFLCILVLVITAISVSMYQSKQTFDEFVENIKVTQKKIKYANDINAAAYRIGYIQYQMIITEDPFERDEVYMDFNKARYNVGFARSELRKLISSPEEMMLYNEQTDLIAEIVTLHENVNNALDNDNFKIAADYRRNFYQQGRFIPFWMNVNQMIALQKKNEQILLQQSEDKFQDILLISIGLLISIAALIALITTYIVSILKQESRKIKESMEALKESNTRHIYLSMHDNLTGLPNRAHFFKKSAQVFADLKSQEANNLFIIFFDLDGFKGINDNLGHAAGDELLREFALRLQNHFAESLEIARFGGDEFVAMATLSKAECTHIVKNVIDTVRAPFSLKGGVITIGTSIGIAEFGRDGSDIDTLIRKADLAMYVAKLKSGNAYHFSDSQDNEIITQLKTSPSSHRIRVV